jgi:hypothetical protein
MRIGIPGGKDYTNQSHHVVGIEVVQQRSRPRDDTSARQSDDVIPSQASNAKLQRAKHDSKTPPDRHAFQPKNLLPTRLL